MMTRTLGINTAKVGGSHPWKTFCVMSRWKYAMSNETRGNMRLSSKNHVGRFFIGPLPSAASYTMRAVSVQNLCGTWKCFPCWLWFHGVHLQTQTSYTNTYSETIHS